MAKLPAATISALAGKWGRAYGVAPQLVEAIIYHESGGDPGAVGDGGLSVGLMQLHRDGARATWRANGHAEPADWFDPGTNVQVGAWYLGVSIPVQLRQIGAADTVRNRVVAYNAGASRVKLADSQLPAVTRDYLAAVARFGVSLAASGRSGVWPVAKLAVVGTALLGLLRVIRDLR